MTKCIVIIVYMLVFELVLYALSNIINMYIYTYDFTFMVGFWSGVSYLYATYNHEKILNNIKRINNYINGFYNEHY